MKVIAVVLIACLFFLSGCDISAFLPASPTTPRTQPITSIPPSSHPPVTSTSSPVVSTVTVAPKSVIPDTPDSGLLITRQYHWEYGGSEWDWELNINQEFYDYYRELPRSPSKDYSVYVTHPHDDTYIDRLVDKLQSAAGNKGYSDFETIEFAVTFVQSLPYVLDDVSTAFDEYPRYPVETLVDNGGDCEDTSILMASIINAMGYGVVLLHFAATETASGHVAVGVKGGEGIYGTYWTLDGAKYYYLETTGESWGIGEIPEDYESARATIYEMKPVPILTHTWTTTGRPGYIDLEITVKNLGTATAQGVYVHAGFDAGDNMLWNSEKSPEFDLDMGEYATVTISLRVPEDKYTRLIVNTVDNGYSVYKTYSVWFDT